MDLQQLRCFLAVAEELHFGRAATRLHLTPSPVSRMIKMLERELGAELFVRRYHDVHLTPVGRELVDRVRAIIDQVDRLPVLTREFTSPNKIVRIGCTHLAPPAYTDRFVEIVEKYAHADSVDLVTAQSSVLLPDVISGDLDAALVHLPVKDPELGQLEITRYRFMVAMRADDELAARPHLELRDLTHRTLTIQPSTPQPLALTRMRLRLTEAGITDFHQMPDYDAVQLASHIRRNRGITLTPAPSGGGAASVFLDPAFAVVPLLDDLEFAVGIVWNIERRAQDELLSLIVDAICAEWGRPGVVDDGQQ